MLTDDDVIQYVKNCSMCAHSCPITAVSCRRGNDYAAWIFSEQGRTYLEQEISTVRQQDANRIDTEAINGE